MKEIANHKPGYRATPRPPGAGSTRLIQVKKPFGLGEPGGLASAEPGTCTLAPHASAGDARRPAPRIRVRLYTLVLVALLALALALGVAAVYAQSGGGYDLTWNTVDGGGAMGSGGGYTLGGTAGQPDAAVWSGGGYTLAGGFWHAASGTTPPGGATKVYLPIIVKP